MTLQIFFLRFFYMCVYMSGSSSSILIWKLKFCIVYRKVLFFFHGNQQTFAALRDSGWIDSNGWICRSPTDMRTVCICVCVKPFKFYHCVVCIQTYSNSVSFFLLSCREKKPCPAPSGSFYTIQNTRIKKCVMRADQPDKKKKNSAQIVIVIPASRKFWVVAVSLVIPVKHDKGI